MPCKETYPCQKRTCPTSTLQHRGGKKNGTHADNFFLTGLTKLQEKQFRKEKLRQLFDRITERSTPAPPPQKLIPQSVLLQKEKSTSPTTRNSAPLLPAAKRRKSNNPGNLLCLWRHRQRWRKPRMPPPTQNKGISDALTFT